MTATIQLAIASHFFYERMMKLRIELHFGDCLNIMQSIPEKSVDLILCDLPYGMTNCKWDEVIPFDALWEQYKRIIKDNSAIVLFAAQPFTTSLISSNMKQYRYNWYWKKDNATGAPFCKVQPMRCIEEICVFYKKAPTYNPQGVRKLDKPIVNKVNGHRVYRKQHRSIQTHTGYPKHLLEFKNVAQKDKIHPTQKPVELLEYLIKTYTNEGAVVLDNCMGVGSTGVACVNTKRHFIGIEKEELFFNTAKNRIDRAAAA